MKLLARSAAFGALAAVVSTAAAQGITGDDNIREGHRLALLICAPCHIVSADQKQRPILKQPTPTFLAIASRKDVSAESIRTFLGTTHATTTPPFKMPNPELADYQMEAIVSYLIGLKGQHWASMSISNGVGGRGKSGLSH